MDADPKTMNQEPTSSAFHGSTCSLLVIPSNPHPNRDWHVIIEVDHQSFALAYKGENRKDAEWMSSMLRIALEKCGARISPANVKEHAPPSMESTTAAKEPPEGGCRGSTCCASSLSYVTLDIAGMDHPKKGRLIVIDKATNEPLPEKYAIQYADSNLGYFVYLDRDTHDPKLVRNRKLEIRCPKEE